MSHNLLQISFKNNRLTAGLKKYKCVHCGLIIVGDKETVIYFAFKEYACEKLEHQKIVWT